MLVAGYLWAPILPHRCGKCPLSLVRLDQVDAAHFGCGVAQWDEQEEKGIGFVTSLGPSGLSLCFGVVQHQQPPHVQNVPRGSEIPVPALALQLRSAPAVHGTAASPSSALSLGLPSLLPDTPGVWTRQHQPITKDLWGASCRGDHMVQSRNGCPQIHCTLYLIFCLLGLKPL